VTDRHGTPIDVLIDAVGVAIANVAARRAGATKRAEAARTARRSA
jgi:hypothetical protein